MKDELVGFEVAKLAEEKGFDIPCRNSVSAQYRKNIQSSLDFTGEEFFTIDHCIAARNNTDWKHYLVPTQSLLQRWLREVHDIHVYVNFNHDIINSYRVRIIKQTSKVRWWSKNEIVTKWETIYDYRDSKLNYERVFEKGLLEALKLIK